MCSGRRQHIYVQRHAQTCTHMHTHLRVVEYMCKYVCVCVSGCLCLRCLKTYVRTCVRTYTYVRTACLQMSMQRKRVYKIHIIYRCHNNNDNYIGTNRGLYYFCYILSNCNCNQLIHLRFSGTAPPALPPHQSPRPCWILWTEKTPSLSSTFEETKKVVVCNYNATLVASLTNLILNYFLWQIQSITSFDNFFTAWLTILCWCGVDYEK